MKESIRKLPTEYIVTALVLLLSVVQVMFFSVEIFLAILITWQTLHHGWKRGLSLLCWMALPLVALIIDHKQAVMMRFAPTFVVCIVAFALALLRRQNISWAKIIFGSCIVLAVVATVLNFSDAVRLFLDKQFLAAMQDAQQHLPAQAWEYVTANKVALQKFYTAHAIAFAGSAALLWTFAYVAIAENIKLQPQQMPLQRRQIKFSQADCVLALGTLVMGVVISLFDNNIAGSWMICMSIGFICFGFASIYTYLISRPFALVSLLAFYIASLVFWFAALPLYALLGFGIIIRACFCLGNNKSTKKK